MSSLIMAKYFVTMFVAIAGLALVAASIEGALPRSSQDNVTPVIR
jgi:hypothetical protein